MTLIDILLIAALAAAMEARASAKRAQIWDALAEIEQRKMDKR